MNRAFNKVIKSHIALAVLTVFAVVLMSAGVTYSLFQIDKRNKENQVVEIGTLSAGATSSVQSIVLNDLYPQSASKVTEEDKKFTFTLTNDGTYDVKYTVYMKDVTDNFLATTSGFEQYTKLTEDKYKYINFRLDGQSNLVTSLERNKEDDKFVVLSGILKAGETEDHYLQFFLDNKDTTTEGAPNDINGSIVSLDLFFDAEAYDENYAILTSKDTLKHLNISVNEGTPNFVSTAKTDEGVYAMEDDYGMSYYYRGAVTNNYVKFAGFYWRIIRINGDGSLRIIYDGTQGYANGVSNTERLASTGKAFNAKYDDAKYVGWMFGGTQGTASTSKVQAQTNETNSDLKALVDSWYKTNIEDKNLGDKVADVIFCNDRTTPGKAETGYSDDTGLGYGSNYTAYGATARTNVWNTEASKVQPRFTCPQKNDAFTVSDETKGNGDLTYPVGLITADEIVAAGSGKYATSNSSYYLYKGTWYWSLSPSCFIGGSASVFRESGGLRGTNIHDPSGAVAPVINLKAEYVNTLRGTGTISDPYTE